MSQIGLQLDLALDAAKRVASAVGEIPPSQAVGPTGNSDAATAERFQQALRRTADQLRVMVLSIEHTLETNAEQIRAAAEALSAADADALHGISTQTADVLASHLTSATETAEARSEANQSVVPTTQSTPSQGSAEDAAKAVEQG